MAGMPQIISLLVSLLNPRSSQATQMLLSLTMNSFTLAVTDLRSTEEETVLGLTMECV